jgi:hypothetical protein
MLGQVADFLTGLANQQTLNQTIPFTNITVGSALDYARAFKHDILDPLFKSGDSLHPDANNDGKVDLSDLNFSSIQALLDRLSRALGLVAITGNPHPLQAIYTFEPASPLVTTDLADSSGITATATTLHPLSEAGFPSMGFFRIVVQDSATDTTNREILLVSAGEGSGAWTVGLAAPTGVTAGVSGTLGTLAAGTYFYKVTAYNGIQESAQSVEVSATVGANGAVNVGWTGVPGATSYRVYRGSASGGQGVYYSVPGLSFTDTGAPAQPITPAAPSPAARTSIA